MSRTARPLLALAILVVASTAAAGPAAAREPEDLQREVVDTLLPEEAVPTLVGPWNDAMAETLQVDDEPTSGAGCRDVWRELKESD